MKLKATVAYHGSGFHGFAVNNDVRTVAGDLQRALLQVFGTPITVTCAGRTDRGVHGRGQVISLDVPDTAEPGRLERSLNGLCGPEIVVRDMQRVDDDFDARFSAKWRRYRYQVMRGVHPDPLRAATAWHVWVPLDVGAMNEAATHLLGEHDFTTFCKRPKVPEGMPDKTLVRNVFEASWVEGEDDLLEFWVQARAFCHQMVRSFVGTLVDVGAGRYEPDSIPQMLAAKDRTAAGQVAPPHGLTFWEVRY